MRITIQYRDGSIGFGNLQWVHEAAAVVTVPGVEQPMSFRFILGDWVAQDGHLMRFDDVLGHTFG